MNITYVNSKQNSHCNTNKYMANSSFSSLTSPPNPHKIIGPVQPAIVDTGSTGIYLPTTYLSLLREISIDITLTVQLPNKQVITSSHSGQLIIPLLPKYNFKVYIFPDIEMPLLSVNDLTERQLQVTFTHTQLIITDHNKITLLTLPRESILWTMPLHAPTESANHVTSTQVTGFDDTACHLNSTQAMANAAFEIPTGNLKALCLFWQRSFCCPSKSTFVKACDWLEPTFQKYGLSKSLLQKHWVSTPEEQFAHLDRTRQNLRSTNPTSAISPLASPPGLSLPPKRNIIFAPYQPTHTNSSDGTGNFMHFQFYFLVMLNKDTNIIHAVMAYNHTAKEYVRAYNEGLEYFAQYGVKPNFEIMDNILAAEIADNLSQQNITVQLVPPANHRTLPAEKAIRTFKNHLNGCLNTTSTLFPLKMVKFLLPHMLKTLNMLRQCKSNPGISAYEGLTGKPYDYNAHPFYPPGCRAIVLDDKDIRGSFANHGREYFWVNSADKHYRCGEFINSGSTVPRISDSAKFLPDMPPVEKWQVLPRIIFNHTIEQQISDLTTTHGQNLPIFQPSAPHLEDLPQHTQTPPEPPGLFMRLKATQPESQDIPYWNDPDDTSSTTVARNPTRQARFNGTYVAHVSKSEGEHPQPITQSDSTSQSAKTEGGLIQPAIHASKAKLKRIKKKLSQRPAKTEGGNPQLKPAHVTSGSTPAMQKLLAALAATAVITAAFNHATKTPRRQSSPPLLSTHDPNKPWDFSGKLLSNSMSYKAATKSEFKSIAEEGFKDEMRRLLTRTKSIVKCNHLPKHVIAPRGNIIVKIKPPTSDKPVVTCRVRLTADGSRSQFTGDRSSVTAEIIAVKIFLNSVASDDDCEMITADLQDAYLSEELPPGQPEYLSLLVSHFPPDCREEFGIPSHLSEDTVIYYHILKGLYGMPQAGLLYQTGLVKHLSQYGYHMSLSTPCLFYHDTSKVKFLLWVDDFIIKYQRSDQASIEHLLNCLRAKYTITVDLTGSSYLGMTIERDRLKKTMTISSPGYIQQMAKDLHLVKGKYVGSPIIYHSTKYSSDPQMEVIDDTPNATLKQIKFLQKLVGKLLFYTLLVEPTIAVAVSRLSSAQSHATELTMEAATRLIQYCLHHPDAVITYHASDMQLICHSDASHQSEPGSRSRITGIYFLGTNSANFEGPGLAAPNLNGCIGFMTTIAPTVCAGAYESEYAALWGNVSNMEPIRQTLLDLGHPQNPTRIIYDNTVAGSLANRTCKQKRSKMVAKQYHWIQERIAFGDYILEWRRGIFNLADFLTKAHSIEHFQEMIPYFVHYPNNSDSTQ